MERRKLGRMKSVHIVEGRRLPAVNQQNAIKPKPSFLKDTFRKGEAETTYEEVEKLGAGRKEQGSSLEERSSSHILEIF